MAERRALRLLVTCEHGGNRVPPRYASLFRGRKRLLDSHRGHDPGALALALAIAGHLRAPLIYSTVTRLLVEPNRSPHHPNLFSEATRGLCAKEKSRILARYYAPHRERVRRAAAAIVEAGAHVVHVGVHTFTPALDGRVRDAHVGLLYDSARAPERAFCARWRAAIRSREPDLRVRMNYPYRGASDGLTTALRGLFPPDAYLGLELEVNQGLLTSGGRWPSNVRRAVVLSLGDALRG